MNPFFLRRLKQFILFTFDTIDLKTQDIGLDHRELLKVFPDMEVPATRIAMHYFRFLFVMLHRRCARKWGCSQFQASKIGIDR